MIEIFHVLPCTDGEGGPWVIRYRIDGQLLQWGEPGTDLAQLEARCADLNAGFTLGYSTALLLQMQEPPAPAAP